MARAQPPIRETWPAATSKHHVMHAKAKSTTFSRASHDDTSVNFKNELKFTTTQWSKKLNKIH